MRYLHYVITAFMGTLFGTTLGFYDEEPLTKFGFIIAMIAIAVIVNWFTWKPMVNTLLLTITAGQMGAMINPSIREYGFSILQLTLLVTMIILCYFFYKEEQRIKNKKEKESNDIE